MEFDTSLNVLELTNNYETLIFPVCLKAKDIIENRIISNEKTKVITDQIDLI